jgi:hypothetical protein
MPCPICNEDNCKKHTILLGKISKKLNIEGSSPPEIFIGRYDYPNVYTGVLSPEEYGNTSEMSSPELWHNHQLSIPSIIQLRNKLVYGRAKSYAKNPNTKFLSLIKEIAMTHKSISTELKLKKPISKHNENDTRSPIISNSAPIQSLILQENPKIKKKIDYLVNDTDVKSQIAIKELYDSNIQNSHIIKILSAGLLGLKANRKLVPTRWSITAVDDTLSKHHLKEIKQFPIIDSFQVFNADYLGNHYAFLLLPDYFSFEVIELSLKTFQVWHDHESFFNRKTYADSVTGAYYANRLALTEYLTKVKHQSSCIVFREVRPSYYAPLGVGILRETSRQAFKNPSNVFNTLNEALIYIQTLFSAPLNYFTQHSIILKNFNKQTRLTRFF